MNNSMETSMGVLIAWMQYLGDLALGLAWRGEEASARRAHGRERVRHPHVVHTALTARLQTTEATRVICLERGQGW
jgi:hypothetical protein